MNRDLHTAPETWEPARRVVERVLRPLERFLHIEAASGVVLLAAALLALLWANSGWAAAYEHLWHMPLSIGVGDLVFERSLHFWINDALMVVFFFVVGLEIRREIHEGELADLKRAGLPIAAAIGGMAVPALIYLLLNPSGPTRSGWGVPMATDIAFAVGVLALLGRRVPPALRVLLLALAIIDDIGAIIVIALFYSTGLQVSGMLVAGAGVLLVLLMQWLGIRRSLIYVLPGAVIWAGMLGAGIHPTIAGVVLGLLTPVRTWFGEEGFIKVAGEALREFRGRSSEATHNGQELLAPLARIRQAQREAVSPVIRIQAALHPWVAFLIMPLFALANAGVNLRGIDFSSAGTGAAALGVIVGLLLGKPIGILLVSWLTVRLGICALPRGVAWSGMALVGCVAGIGFTMAIFVANLAFPGAELLGAAKVGVLVASLAAALGGLAIGVFVLPSTYDRSAAQTLQEAEASTEA